MKKNMNIKARKDIKALWDKGVSIHAIAKKLGRTDKSVSGYLKRMGLKSHFQAPKKIFSDKQLLDCMNKYMGFGYMMKELQCSSSTLKKHLRKNGYYEEKYIKEREDYRKKERYNECIGFYSKDKTVTFMSENSGIAYEKFRTFIKENNLPCVHGKQGNIKMKIMSLINEGMTPHEILLEGIGGKQYVGNQLRKLGYSIGHLGEKRINRCKECEEIYNRSNHSWQDTLYCDQCKEKSKIKFLIYINNKNKYQKSGSKKRGMNYNLDRRYLYDLWKQQEGKCAYTGNKLTESPREGERIIDNRWVYPTIDRIDSDKGYIKGNVLWVCDQINAMKNNCTLEELKTYMPLVYERIVYWLPIIKGV